MIWISCHKSMLCEVMRMVNLSPHMNPWFLDADNFMQRTRTLEKKKVPSSLVFVSHFWVLLAGDERVSGSKNTMTCSASIIHPSLPCPAPVMMLAVLKLLAWMSHW